MKSERAKRIADDLLAWMRKENFEGWDPHDALNSPFLRPLSELHRWAGVAALQIVKRCPVNLRHVLLVPKTRNAKGLGLTLAALVRRYQLWREISDLDRALWTAEWLASNVSSGYSGACWGYPFDWANRAFYAPKGTPTIVNTSFIGHGYLDLYEVTGKEHCLSLAQSACDFICQDLNRSQGKRGFSFSYTPTDWSQVHNANLHGASLLARVGKMANHSDFMKLSLESASFSIEAQRPDGSWPYGEASNQKWIDSFHTGYNLLALKHISEATGDSGVKESLDKGYSYYLEHFFLPDGTVKYYHDRPEPLDTHAFAHAVICLCEMDGLSSTPADLAGKVLERMIDLFWSGKGYFYWQKKGGFLYQLPCMRWVQAWAFLALSTYLFKTGNNLSAKSGKTL